MYDKSSLRRFFSGDKEYPLGNKNITIISLIFLKNSISFSSEIRYDVVAKTIGFPVSLLEYYKRAREGLSGWTMIIIKSIE